MTTIFDVPHLGIFASIDPIAGNTEAESASVSVGETIAGPGAPLFDAIQLGSPGTTGFAGGIHSGACEQGANSGEVLSRVHNCNNQFLLRSDHSPALRTALAISESF